MTELASVPTHLAITVDKKVSYPAQLQIERHKTILEYSFMGSVSEDGAVLRQGGSFVKYLENGSQ